MSAFAQTPSPPYYAVIFTSQRTEGDQDYGDMAELAHAQPGYQLRVAKVERVYGKSHQTSHE